MSKRDYYEVLGVERSADAAAIKKAYRKLAKKYHPDTNAGDQHAEQMFKEATEAYEVLSDPEKRKLYDRFGHAAFDGSSWQDASGGAGNTGGFRGAGSYQGFHGFDGFQDSGSYQGFHNFRGFGGNGGYQEFHFEGGDMDDLFGDLFGGGFRGSGSRRGADLRAEVSVSFEEAAFGCDKVIRLQGEDGRLQSLQVHIPAGIESGKSIRLRGKGAPGTGGGQAGDLLLQVTVGDKPGFERKGLDVYTTVSIPFTTAVFGGEATVPTLTGHVICRIKEGTQSGSRIRLRGKGIVSISDPNVHGDQYVTVQIQVPTHLSREAKQKLKEYEEACGGRGQNGGRRNRNPAA
ncbi:MAG TPA: DnaJ domain-containing protein [Candidatus Eisenbergiella merdavium]|uniref:DnaJ domain-containing protein n=1 Tax=Candidatus Eisenbergiella merdavium TaxID=2838551 RepID=A0A9D2NEB3_9FIRM|nr:DnaJ domain-containing protein [Candidatus Eisenbergiella merdavium]